MKKTEIHLKKDDILSRFYAKEAQRWTIPIMKDKERSGNEGTENGTNNDQKQLHHWQWKTKRLIDKHSNKEKESGQKQRRLRPSCITRHSAEKDMIKARRKQLRWSHASTSLIGVEKLVLADLRKKKPRVSFRSNRTDDRRWRRRRRRSTRQIIPKWKQKFIKTDDITAQVSHKLKKMPTGRRGWPRMHPVQSTIENEHAIDDKGVPACPFNKSRLKKWNENQMMSRGERKIERERERERKREKQG